MILYVKDQDYFFQKQDYLFQYIEYVFRIKKIFAGPGLYVQN